MWKIKKIRRDIKNKDKDINKGKRYMIKLYIKKKKKYNLIKKEKLKRLMKVKKRIIIEK